MRQKQYTNRQDAMNKGFIKKNGIYYRQTVLEVWHSKGWLELKNSRFSADDRLQLV